MRSSSSSRFAGSSRTASTCLSAQSAAESSDIRYSHSARDRNFNITGCRDESGGPGDGPGGFPLPPTTAPTAAPLPAFPVTAPTAAPAAAPLALTVGPPLLLGLRFLLGLRLLLGMCGCP